MQTWAYPALIETHGPDDYTAAFPDLPGALTGGSTPAEVRLNAFDALEEAVLHLMATGVVIPPPREAGEGEELIVLDPVTAARAVLANAMREDKVSNVALAKRLGQSEGPCGACRTAPLGGRSMRCFRPWRPSVGGPC